MAESRLRALTGDVINYDEELANRYSPNQSVQRGFNSALAGFSASAAAQEMQDAERAKDQAAFDQAYNQFHQGQRDAQLYAPRVTSLRDAQGLGDIAEFALGQAPGVALSMGPSIAGALLTRGRSPLTQALGTVYPSFAMSRNEITADQYNDPEIAKLGVDERAQASNVGGLAMGALESIVPAGLASRFAKPMVGKLENSVIKTAGEEALTETSQTVAQHLAAKALNENRQLDPWDLADAAVAGAAGGGMASGVMDAPGAALGGLKYMAADVSQRIQNRRNPGDTTLRPDDADGNEISGIEPDGPDAPAGSGNRAAEAVKRGKKYVDDLVSRMRGATDESPEDAARRSVDEVFGDPEADDLDILGAGEADPSMVGATDEETQANFEQNDAKRGDAAARRAADILNDPDMPQFIKNRVTNMNGAYDNPINQNFVYSVALGKKRYTQLKAGVESLGEMLDKNPVFKEAKDKFAEFKQSDQFKEAKAAYEARKTQFTESDQYKEAVKLYEATKDKVGSFDASKAYKSAKAKFDEFIKKRPKFEDSADFVATAEEFENPKQLGYNGGTLGAKLLGDQTKRSNLMNLSEAELQPLTDHLVKQLGPNADQAPKLARQLAALSVRMGPINQFNAATDMQLRGLSAAIDDDTLDVLTQVTGNPALRDGLKKILTIPSAEQDAVSGKEDSFLGSMLAEKVSTNALKALGAGIDMMVTPGRLDARSQAEALKGITKAFGTQERAQAVLEYYGNRRKEAFEQYEQIDESPDPRDEIAQRLEADLAQNAKDIADEARGFPIDGDVDESSTDSGNAEFGALTEKDGAPIRYGFRYASSELPFRKHGKDGRDDSPEGVIALNKFKGQTANAEAYLENYSTFLENDKGMTPLQGAAHVRKDIARRMEDHKAKRDKAEENGNKKEVSYRKQQISLLEAELARFNDSMKERGARAALDMYQVIALGEDLTPIEDRITDADLAAMANPVTYNGKNEESVYPGSEIVFEKVGSRKDGTPTSTKKVLSSVAIVNRMMKKREKAGTTLSAKEESEKDILLSALASLMDRTDLKLVSSLEDVRMVSNRDFNPPVTDADKVSAAVQSSRKTKAEVITKAPKRVREQIVKLEAAGAKAKAENKPLKLKEAVSKRAEVLAKRGFEAFVMPADTAEKRAKRNEHRAAALAAIEFSGLDAKTIAKLKFHLDWLYDRIDDMTGLTANVRDRETSIEELSDQWDAAVRENIQLAEKQWDAFAAYADVRRDKKNAPKSFIELKSEANALLQAALKVGAEVDEAKAAVKAEEAKKQPNDALLKRLKSTMFDGFKESKTAWAEYQVARGFLDAALAVRKEINEVAAAGRDALYEVQREIDDLEKAGDIQRDKDTAPINRSRDAKRTGFDNVRDDGKGSSIRDIKQQHADQKHGPQLRKLTNKELGEHVARLIDQAFDGGITDPKALTALEEAIEQAQTEVDLREGLAEFQEQDSVRPPERGPAKSHANVYVDAVLLGNPELLTVLDRRGFPKEKVKVTRQGAMVEESATRMHQNVLDSLKGLTEEQLNKRLVDLRAKFAEAKKAGADQQAAAIAVFGDALNTALENLQASKVQDVTPKAKPAAAPLLGYISANANNGADTIEGKVMSTFTEGGRNFAVVHRVSDDLNKTEQFFDYVTVDLAEGWVVPKTSGKTAAESKGHTQEMYKKFGAAKVNASITKKAADDKAKKSAMNQRKGRPSSSKAREAAITAIVKKMLGPKVKVAFAKFAKGAGSGQYRWDEASMEHFIDIATNSEDMMGVAWHESLHAFFQSLGTDQTTRNIRRDLVDAASAPHIMRQLRSLLRDHKDALEQLENSPEERAAYAFQFWSAGVLEMRDGNKNIFQKVWDFIRELLSLADSTERGEEIFEKLRDGAFADMSIAGEVIRDMQNKTFTNKMEQYAPGVIDLGRKLVNAKPDRLRQFNIPALHELADAFSSERGELGFIQRRMKTDGVWLNKLEKVFAGTNATDRRKAIDNLQAMRDPTSPLEKRLAEFLKDANTYAQASGVKRYDSKTRTWNDVRTVKKYFPRTWDPVFIKENMSAWKKLLKDVGKMDDAAINDTTKAIITGDGRIELAEGPGHLGFTPFMTGALEREFKFINESNAHEFARFQQKDAMEIMIGYTRQMVHRGEYAKMFGNAGEGIAAALDSARLTPTEAAEATKIVRGLEGTLESGNLSREVKGAMSAIMTAQNVILLPLTLFSQAVDPIILAARTGNVADAGKAFMMALGQMKVEKAYGMKLAVMMGIISAESTLEAMGMAYGNTYMTAGLRRVNQIFFKYNGSQYWNNIMRISATVAGEQYLLDNIKSKENLSELGLTAADVVRKPDGRLAVTADEIAAVEGKPVDAAMEAKATRIHEAMFRFVDQAVLRPSASHRPLWMSDPRFLLVGHLKQFTFAMHNVVLKRAREQMDKGNPAPMGILMLSMPVILASDLVKMFLTGKFPTNWGVLDYIMHSFQRSGLAGVYDFGLSAQADVARGKAPGEGLLGPAAEHAFKVLRFMFSDPRVSFGDVINRTVPFVRYF